MRFYALGNMYLSSIQQGIQAFHALGDMYVKYQTTDSPQLQQLNDWAKDHKTVICLNGGTSADLRNFYVSVLCHKNNTGIAFEKFHEDAVSLDGALTCVGVIVPERIYNIDLKSTMPWHRAMDYYGVTPWEYSLAEYISRCGLAR